MQMPEYEDIFTVLFLFSCPVSPPAGPFNLTQAFEADMAFSSYDGTGWCILTGKVDASRWYTLDGGLPVTTMYFQVTIDFCDDEDGVGFGQGFEQQKCIDVSWKLNFTSFKAKQYFVFHVSVAKRLGMVGRN